jgi:predicted heme/steroid binding protein
MDPFIDDGEVYILLACVVVIALLAIPHLVSWRKREAYRVASLAMLQRVPCVIAMDELRRFNGKGGLPILVSMDGRIFDMTPAPEFYGEGSGYHVYAGREAGRALGKMTLINDKPQHIIDLDEPWVLDLTAEQVKTKSDWIAKFVTKYKVVGRLHRESAKAEAAAMAAAAATRKAAASFDRSAKATSTAAGAAAALNSSDLPTATQTSSTSTPPTLLAAPPKATR